VHEKYLDNMALKKLKKRKTKRKIYTAGGMYSNTIPPGLATTNLVLEESNPEVLEAKEEKLKQTTLNLQEESQNVSEEIAQDEVTANQQIENVAAQSNAQADAIVSGTKNIADTLVKPKNNTEITKIGAGATGSNPIIWDPATGDFVKQGIGGKGTSLFGAFKKAGQAYKAQRATNQAIKSGQLMASSAGTAGKAGLTSLGQGLGSFAKSGAGIGTIAALAGAGVTKLSDDDDATTLNFGEGAGATLSGIGTGIGAAATAAMLAGSTLGPAGTLIGGALGAIYGLGKGLLSRGKARREEKRLTAERDKKISDYETKQKSKFLTARSSARATELKSKTFSGYDLGINAKLGGLRLGIPRYGN